VSIDRVKNPILYGERLLFLALQAKVLKDWRNDENAMQRLGIERVRKRNGNDLARMLFYFQTHLMNHMQ
jgi:hypothetical protein